MGHQRRGFSLLEVMVALSILTTSMVIMVQIQAGAARQTSMADEIIVATQLAQEKLTEVRLLVEKEGFQTRDVTEKGDFDDFGDEALNLEFEELERFHWEYLITEVDLGLGSDLGEVSSALGGAENASGTSDADMLGSMPGVSGDMVTQMIEPYVREVRVQVWWGENQDEAEEYGNEVTLTMLVADSTSSAQRNLPTGGQQGIP